MRLTEATTRFIDFLQSQEIGSSSQFPDLMRNEEVTPEALSREQIETSLNLLTAYFSDVDFADIATAQLRDFLARWYVEEATANFTSLYGRPSVVAPAHNNAERGGQGRPPVQASENQSDFENNDSRILPDAKTFLAALGAFFQWTKQNTNNEESPDHLTILDELQETLPHAITLGVALSQAVTNRGGAFLFPEFLTSFEAGGHSEYDIGTGGEASPCESYFRIVKIEENEVEAEDLLLEENVAPILFPEIVVPLLKENYIINLELLPTQNGWQILQCGFAYPPNTEV